MDNIDIFPAVTSLHLDEVRGLLRTYADLRNHDAALGNFAEELRSLPGEFAPPEGCLLLATHEGEPAGVVAYRKIAPAICEMKRMFVLPAFRGKGIGSAMGHEILNRASRAGYEVMKLDTHPWMDSAHRIYQSLGFAECSRYNDNPTPGIRFFEKKLTQDR